MNKMRNTTGGQGIIMKGWIQQYCVCLYCVTGMHIGSPAGVLDIWS